jgi:hypothetical protein
LPVREKDGEPARFRMVVKRNALDELRVNPELKGDSGLIEGVRHEAQHKYASGGERDTANH